MRPTAWVSVLAVSLLSAAFCNGLSTAQARPVRPAPAERMPSWVVAGDWMATDEEAVQDALDKSQGKVNEYLRARTPPMEWSIDRTYLQQKLWHDLNTNDPAFVALKWENPEPKKVNGRVVQVETMQLKGLGDMRRASVKVAVSESDRDEFAVQEQKYQEAQRQQRATKRQAVLARVLAGLVALLVAVACYLRLEDATKGYYTTLLRVAAVAFVSLVGAGIWLLTT